MPTRSRAPFWLIFGGAFLALVAGLVNAVGLLGLAQALLTHATGNLTRVALGAVRLDGPLLSQAGLPLASFFAGTVFSGMVTRNERFKAGRRYGILMLVEATLLVAATLFFVRGVLLYGELVAALAMGLQNGMMSKVNELVVRTTHMTGIVTDLGMKLGAILRGAVVRGDRLLLHGSILTGFITGGVAGVLGFSALGFLALLLPAGLLFVMGGAYLTLRLRRPEALRRFLDPGPEGPLF